VLVAGERAPDFELPDHAGQIVALESLRSAGPVVLFFYPGDFTPICTREVCMVRNIHADLDAAGLRVVGISPDAPEKHARFKADLELPFTLLADTRKQVVKLYGVDGPLGFGVRRASFLIDPAGVIVDTLLADWRVSRHETFLRRAEAMRRTALNPAP